MSKSRVNVPQKNSNPMSLKLAAALCAVAGLTASALAQPKADVTPQGGMLRFPDISATHITFVYANDVWIAPRDGGRAVPLSSPAGAEGFPRFSPDGKSVAFLANYDGNRDIYTIPVDGGAPSRVTYHPGAEQLADWTPDGKLLFFTNSLGGLSRQTQLFTVPAAGGLYAKLPVPYGAFGSISPDGSTLAYTPHSTDNRTWKRYRGGMATDIWLYNLKDNSAQKVTDWEGTDTLPMWVPGSDGSKLYYLSDAGPEHRLNVWSYDAKSKARTQITKFKDFDIRWPSIGPGPGGKGEIIFQLGSELRVLDLANGRDRAVNITIPGDRAAVRSRVVDAARNITGGSISPTGKRVAIEGRGDIWSVPAKEGVVRNLTRTDSVFEREVAWSPDGKHLAYFSDESGEYELWVRPSDARPPEADKKDEGKKDEAKKDEGAKDEPKAEETKAPEAPRKLTAIGEGFRTSPRWSPDSKFITFTDNAGRVWLTEVATGTTQTVATDAWGNIPNPQWSHDSAWLTFTLSDEASGNGCVHVYNLADKQLTRLTSPIFPASNPTFDAKGDWLFFSSNRDIDSPIYSDLDTTFIYANTEVMLAVPLRADVKNPWLPKSDEETLKEDKKKDEKKPDAKKDEGKKDEGAKPDSAVPTENAVGGTWEGETQAPGPNGQTIPIRVTLSLRLEPGNKVSGNLSSPMGGAPVSGSFDPATGSLSLAFTIGGGNISLTGTITGEEFTGSWSAGDQSGPMTAKRTSKAQPAAEAEAKKDEPKKDDDKKPLKIDLEGFESRAVQLPIPSGSFGPLAVSHDNKLLYIRGSARGMNEPTSIRIFDLNDEERAEKTVTQGGGFELSGDRKKLLVFRGGGNMVIVDAAAGGGKSQTVSTEGMRTTIDPRDEWKQIMADVYRLMRDYFYEPSMHGNDWKALSERYSKLVDDAVNREDVTFIIAELISELNIGHAYVGSPGDVEAPGRAVSVGLLGVDFALDQGAFKIARILRGAPWDTDAVGPLSQPGVDVKEGDYLLAVNGVPLDTSKDPYAAFQGLAERTVTLTVSAKPTLDASAREVLVRPISSENNLRYRDWIERNRAYVEKASDGKVGYVYVPNTGVDGQSDLVRQFIGNRARAALIIDERWNGGGQIPTRFIEMLNRPVTNYWARRHGKSWTWPPDGHQGPKAMLINGLAGSGGDAFPAYFRMMGLGKLIGTRTWGGLVGISGNPALIDGGSITVPTFGYYKKDGTWGIEGHGVDPDMEVLDDPSKMVNGADPQLDAAVAHLLEELKTKAFTPAPTPPSPNRSGMGIPERDR
ncbi:MAG: PDZ domain-containing protein [Planctomycetota bacterium]|nr:PDZ domain-containing protein [Planctomycetota bacterium]